MSNSKRKCPYCKAFNRPDGDGVMLINNSLYCNLDHAVQNGIKNAPKARKKIEKEKKSQKHKEKKERLYWNIKHQEKITQLAVNAFIRKLDEGKACISCRKPVCGRSMQAGHYKGKGAHLHMRYDPRNIYLQGSGCNENNSTRRFNRGESVSKDYEKNLIEDYGQVYVDWLNGYHPESNYTCDDLRMIRAVFIAEKNKLDRGEKPSRNWRQLDYDFMVEVASLYKILEMI